MSDGSTWFAERFALSELDDGAVLVDLQSGEIYQLNTTAARILGTLARAGRAAAEEEARCSGDSSPAAARLRVDQLIADLRAETPPLRTPTLSFEPARGGYRLRHAGRAVLHVDSGGGVISLEEPGDPAAVPTGVALRWSLPHVAALQGRPALHASAVSHGPGVLAFCGPSGAGKTTIARAFASAGSVLVSEDLLLATPGTHGAAVFVDGERTLDRWLVAGEARLLGARHEPVDATGLLADLGPETLPLREVWFVDPSRRSGDSIVREPLHGSAAMLRLLENSFAETGDRRVWLDVIAMSRMLATSVKCACVTVPDGLDALRRAALAYSTISTS